MSKLILLAIIFVVGVAAQDENPPNRIAPRADFSIGTPDFKTWGQVVANASKQPTEIVKDSVNLVKDSVKMGTSIGAAVVGKGLNLTKDGVTSVTDIGKMTIGMGTTIANQTLGIVGKVGGMIPIAGGIVSTGIGLGQTGITGIQSVGNMLMDSISWWLGGGIGLVANATAAGNNLLDTAADAVGSAVNSGLDMKANVVGGAIEAGFNLLPSVTVNASVNAG